VGLKLTEYRIRLLHMTCYSYNTPNLITFLLNPAKIIKLLWMAVDNTSAKVKGGNKLSEPFRFSAGRKKEMEYVLLNVT
jgi:hypothetical protein